ncbi:hypothetical protein E4T39_04102 [Aureobasidium subglaciale]|nr:hypothetical protein E4T39_04102 [Aureobasidium subglaciale]
MDNRPSRTRARDSSNELISPQPARDLRGDSPMDGAPWLGGEYHEPPLNASDHRLPRRPPAEPRTHRGFWPSVYHFFSWRGGLRVFLAWGLAAYIISFCSALASESAKYVASSLLPRESAARMCGEGNVCVPENPANPFVPVQAAKQGVTKSFKANEIWGFMPDTFHLLGSGGIGGYDQAHYLSLGGVLGIDESRGFDQVTARQHNRSAFINALKTFDGLSADLVAEIHTQYNKIPDHNLDRSTQAYLIAYLDDIQKQHGKITSKLQDYQTKSKTALDSVHNFRHAEKNTHASKHHAADLKTLRSQLRTIGSELEKWLRKQASDITFVVEEVEGMPWKAKTRARLGSYKYKSTLAAVGRLKRLRGYIGTVLDMVARDNLALA